MFCFIFPLQVVVYVLIVNVLVLVLADHEISFTLNLYPDGYSIGKPPEVCLRKYC